MKGVYDKRKIPRETLAYLIDSTGSPVCVLIPFSSWAVYFGSIFFSQDSVQALGCSTWLEAYVKAIPFCIYPIVTLIILFLFSFGFFPKLGKMDNRRKPMSAWKKPGWFMVNPAANTI